MAYSESDKMRVDGGESAWMKGVREENSLRMEGIGEVDGRWW